MTPTTKYQKKVDYVKIIKFICLILLMLIYVLPFIWVLNVSLKTNGELFRSPFAIAEHFRWKNYYKAIFVAKLGVAIKNSVVISVSVLIANVALSSLASFAIARMRFRVREVFKIYFLIGMMVPMYCVITPLFKWFSELGLTNTTIGVIIPDISFSLPMSIFIMTNFFRGMSTEMFEAACIDGCSIYNCFVKIAFPLSRNGLFISGMMCFINVWNELLIAMVFISDKELKPLPVALTAFVSPYATNYTEMFAAIVITIIPSILAYSLFSNNIVDGLTQGAIKS